MTEKTEQDRKWEQLQERCRDAGSAHFAAHMLLNGDAMSLFLASLQTTAACIANLHAINPSGAPFLIEMCAEQLFGLANQLGINTEVTDGATANAAE